MKKIVFLVTVLLFSLSLTAFYITEHTIQSILKTIDVTDERAKNDIFNNISYLQYYYPAPRELRKVPEAEKLTIINIVGKFVKSFTKSESFAGKYKEYWEDRKPQEPKKPETMSEAQSKQKEQMKKSIAEMEANMKKMPENQKATFAEVIKSLKQQQAEMEKQNNSATNAQMDSYLQQDYEQRMQEYKDKLAEWEKELSASPERMVKKWLEAFLEKTKDVDFNAELKEKYGKKIFVNKEYEGKSQEWKLCFRSGKTATEAARSFAKAWLDELKDI